PLSSSGRTRCLRTNGLASAARQAWHWHQDNRNTGTGVPTRGRERAVAAGHEGHDVLVDHNDVRSRALLALIGSTRETRPPFSIVTTPKKKGLRPGCRLKKPSAGSKPLPIRRSHACRSRSC